MGKIDDMKTRAEGVARQEAEKHGAKVKDVILVGEPYQVGAAPNQRWQVKVRLEMGGGEERAFLCDVTEEHCTSDREVPPG